MSNVSKLDILDYDQVEEQLYIVYLGSTGVFKKEWIHVSIIKAIADGVDMYNKVFKNTKATEDIITLHKRIKEAYPGDTAKTLKAIEDKINEIQTSRM